MDFIFASGTGSARPTGGLATLLLCLAAPLMLGAGPAGRLDVSLLKLRNLKGDVHLCLTRSPAHFPDCADDPHAMRRSAPAARLGEIDFSDLPSGNYALSVVHDENGNGRLDTWLKMPREGFGFSRNPPIRFGPPTFEQARFAVASGEVREAVRMRYLL